MLALDALAVGFYCDWLRVAGEEALHFSLLTSHLRTFGHANAPGG